jgi:hypothetical protein
VNYDEGFYQRNQRHSTAPEGRFPELIQGSSRLAKFVGQLTGTQACSMGCFNDRILDAFAFKHSYCPFRRAGRRRNPPAQRCGIFPAAGCKS